MNRRSKKRILKELVAIASLRDSDIDTSDIPEITDWSRAIVGRFSFSRKARPNQPASLGAAFAPGQSPGPNLGALLSQGDTLAEMTHQELVAQCVGGQVTAWDEFIRRWNQLIALVVLQTGRRIGRTSPELLDDLVQETYLKLCANDFQSLRGFLPSHESAFVAYLKIFTANVVNDHFRSAYPSKRTQGLTSNELKPELEVLESSDVDTTAERAVLLEEIDRLLSASASERDQTIFRLYYRIGLSAKEIASIPEIKLTVKGVESVISRLNKGLGRDLKQEISFDQSQKKD